MSERNTLLQTFIEIRNAQIQNDLVDIHVGVLLPYGRSQESEADILGLEYMARAGFDPRQSIDLWQNIAWASREQPPEFLSTHPSHNTRIEQLNAHMARARGRSARCEIDR